jgi:hypothetical protein
MADMHQSRNRGFVLSRLLLGFLVMLLFPVMGAAQSELVAVEGAEFNVDASLSDNLKIYIGNRLHITLDSGAVLAGTVKAVGAHAVHLEKLDGKDYFDALIPIDNISAIEARFRTLRK